MPILFNKESGLAEDVPNETIEQSLQGGTHEIPLISPDGEVGSVDRAGAKQLISQGYRQPTPEELQGLLKTAKYSTPTQQIIGGVEQVAKGVAGPLATLGSIF